MAYLLNKWKENTIRNQMYRYLAVVISAVVLINIFSLVFNGLNVKQYEEIMNQVLNLNQYYEILDDGNGILGLYVQKGNSEIYNTFSVKIENAYEYLGELERTKVSQMFLRDVQDMEKMLESYGETADSINKYFMENNQKSFNADMFKEILGLYEESQEKFSYIENEFKNLQLQLLDYANARMEILKQKKGLYYIEFLCALVFMVGWSLISGRKMADHIVSPVQKLTEVALKIRNGDMLNFTEVEINDSDSREVAILVNVFNKMINKIQEQFRLTEETAKAKAELHLKELENLKILNLLKSSELKVLQMQMNPHFLFNTLNMIAKTAYLGDSEETVFLLQKTAQLLRYSLDYMGKSVTLARELEILDSYVCLQEKRFGNRIDFDFNLDERFHDIQIPCFILQPLVENAITHGVGMYTEGGKILISTVWIKEEGMGMISVIDNGMGMEPCELKEVRCSLNEEWNFDDRIGLGNVYMRLENFFHGDAKMEIYSIPKKKTEIRILLPVRKGEDICIV